MGNLSMRRKRSRRLLGGNNGETEHCMNPWNGKCYNSDILLYIYYDGRRLPICRSCWSEIVKKDLEWD